MVNVWLSTPCKELWTRVTVDRSYVAKWSARVPLLDIRFTTSRTWAIEVWVESLKVQKHGLKSHRIQGFTVADRGIAEKETKQRDTQKKNFKGTDYRQRPVLLSQIRLPKASDWLTSKDRLFFSFCTWAKDEFSSVKHISSRRSSIVLIHKDSVEGWGRSVTMKRSRR